MAAPERPNRVAPKRTPEIGTLAATYSEWQDVYMPFNCRCSQPMSINLSGRATMEAGKYIYLSLRVLGMEVGQVWVDTDSVFIAEKIGKTLMAEPFSRLSARTGLDINDLQALLLGQAFYPGAGALRDPLLASQQFSVTTQDDGMLMTPRRTPQGATWYFTIAPGPRLSGLTIEPDGMKPFTALFEDATQTPAGSIATEISVAGSLATKAIDATIFWNPDKAKWNEGSTAEKPSWRGYRRVDSHRLINSLKF